MTAENKKLNVADEIQRADGALAAADLLKEHGHLKDAVSRLCYCCPYHVRAALLTKDLEPKSREAAPRLFSLHFVRTRALPPADAHLFSRLMKYREEADYNPSYLFSEEDYDQMRGEAAAFIRRVRQHLGDQGYLRSAPCGSCSCI